MAMQQSIMEGSLRNTHQRVSLIWKKEISTLERIINYFDHSGEKIELPWDTSKKFYEGTAELTFGKHSGSLFISDQPIEGPLFQVFSFEVNKQKLGVVQEILLQIGTDPSVPSPQPAIKRISSEEITSFDSTLMQPPGDSDEVGTYAHQEPVLTKKEPPLTSSLGLAKREKDRLEGEKRILMDECARVKQEKQKIKEESFEIDEQLISAMEQLSAYERQQALMEERHNALLREARLLEEDNLAMKAVINEKDIKSAGDCETIRQLKVDVQFNNDKIEQMREEKVRLVAKCSDLEQRCATSDQIEVFKAEEEFEQEKEKQRNRKELAIFRSDNERLREKDIPSLLQDIDELKQQNMATTEQYQKESQITKTDRDHLHKEMQTIRVFLNLDAGEKKPIDPSKIEPDTRDSMKLMDQLSRHFEECSNALYKLVQLLEANIGAKETQLERRMRELREARNRNDSLVQEVFSRGQEINHLTERLRTIMTTPVTVSPQSNVVASPESDLGPEATKHQNFNPPSAFPPIINPSYIPTHSPSSSNLETYKPVIKAMYRDLPNVTNTLIDFQKAPTHVMKMTYLEDPQSHIGNQVICMLKENYSVGTLMTVFQYRPSLGGLGTLLPITYAGIQFEEAIGESNGVFKGTAYFTCPADSAEFISVENVFIRV